MKITPEEQAIYLDFEYCGKNAKKWTHKCILLLPKIEKMRIWEKKGFSSIYEFAAKLAGMSRDKVNEGLRILGKTENMPEIQKIIEKKGIWAVRPIISVVTPENQRFWAEKAKIMSQHTLAAYVGDIKNADSAKALTTALSEDDCSAGSVGGAGNDSRNVGGAGGVDGAGDGSGRGDTAGNDGVGLTKPILFQKFQKFEMKLKPETVQRLIKVKGKENWEILMQEFLEYKEEKEKHWEEEIEAKKPKTVQTTSRPIPLKIQKYVKARAKNKCEVPNCTKPGKYLHHTVPFALKKEHDPDKIFLLCEAHHNIAHYGLIYDEDKRPQNWEVRRFHDILDFRSVINERVAEFKRREFDGGG